MRKMLFMLVLSVFLTTDAVGEGISHPMTRMGEIICHEGSPRIPVLLVEFADTKMTVADVRLHFEEKLCRAATLSEVEAGRGSAAQYFADQSHGRFTPSFDVIGPVTLDKGYAAYGVDEGVQDSRVGSMIAEAVRKAVASDEVADWSVYDNDRDGMVDAVYVFYAGEGQHAYPMRPDLIWPHSYKLSERGETLPEADGVKFDTYSCSSEMLRGKPDGFGTFCHEFCHILGLPDFYRTDGKSVEEFNMGSWSVMDYGQYAGEGFLPVGMRALEKEWLGWGELVELTEAATVSEWSSTDSDNNPHGRAFKMARKNGATDEYYVMETVDGRGWNKALPACGLLVTRVYQLTDDVWKDNEVNNANPARVHVVAADNSRTALVYGENDDAYAGSLVGDTYPCAMNGNDELTDTSLPNLYSMYSFSGKFGRGVTGITYDENNGTVSFLFMGGSEDNVITGVRVPMPASDDSVKKGYYRMDGVFCGVKRPYVPGIYMYRDAGGTVKKIWIRK